MVLTSDKVENLNVTDSSVYLKGVGKTKECPAWKLNLTIPVRAEAGLSEQNGQITGNFNSQTWDWSGLRVKKHLRTAPTFMKSEG